MLYVSLVFVLKMVELKTLIALLLYRLLFVHAASLPSLFQVLSVDDTLPSILIASKWVHNHPNLEVRHIDAQFPSATNTTAPTPPSGFKAELKFNDSIQLTPVEVYMYAIKFMSLLSNLGWNDYIQTYLSMSYPRFGTVCGMGPLPKGAPLKLQIKYAALGLYKAGVAISQNQFYQLYVKLLLEDEQIGWIEFAPKKSESTQNTALTIYTASFEAKVSNATLTADSGFLVDPEDSKFRITYQWDGVKIKAQDIFTSFLDALVISAQYENNVIAAEIPAARGVSGDVVLSTWKIENYFHLTWARLKIALFIIWEQLVIGGQQRARFEGMSFWLEYAEVKIGGGRILRFDKGTDGTNITDIAATLK